jgi:hypothetical protein
MRTGGQTRNGSECAVSRSRPSKAIRQDDATTHIDFALSEVVEILAHSLSKAEFSRVCAILISNDVLGQPDLPRKIRSAFCCAPPLDIPADGEPRTLAQKRDRCAFDNVAWNAIGIATK